MSGLVPRFSVQIPGTSANLGPGFDSLGLALSLYDVLEVAEGLSSDIRVRVRGVGEGSLPEDQTNLIARSLLHVYDRFSRPAPSLELIAHNRLSHGRGLGSSAAAICAGVVAAKKLLEKEINLGPGELLSLATELEGHPDNVAPALFGGLTIAWMGEAEEPAYKQLIPHRSIKPVVFIPEQRMSTHTARSLQPDSVPCSDAVFNLSRSALLVVALTQSPELLFEATEDRLHQAYRASAMPATHFLIQKLRSAGFAAVVSGAGPSVMVLTSDPSDRLRAVEFVKEVTSDAWPSLMPAIDYKGATIIPG